MSTTRSPAASGADNPHAPTPAELGYDPWDPGFVAEPYPALARLRTEAPLIYDERTNQWLVSRHADVNALLRDRRLGRSYLHVASHEAWGRTPPPADQAPFWDLLAVQMIDMEPPDHTRLRRLVSKAFTPRTVEIAPTADRGDRRRVIDGALAMGELDLIADLLELVPVTVIAELLGIPEADRHLLRPWSADMTLMFELNPTPEAQRRATEASAAFEAYLRALARERRRTPGADLISELAAVVETGGDRLTEDELIGTAVLLLNAGHEASVNGAANSWWALFRHPEALARLRAEPALVPTAIEELLRFDTPAPMFERWVLEEIELHGVTIPRGQELALQFAAANRDPAVFADPDRDRPRPVAQPVPLVRRGDPLLPRRTAGQAGVRHPVRADASAPATARAPRGAGLEAALRPPRPRGAAGPGMSDDARAADRARTIAYLDLQEGRSPVPLLDDAGIESRLRASHRVAVVGASSNPGRPSFGVFRYLVEEGFDCVPINPNEREVLGITAFATVEVAVEATGPFDLVDVFRRSELCVPHALEAVAAGARCLWLQLGVVNWEAARIAHDAGVEVVMDRCTAIEWRRITRVWPRPAGSPISE